MGIYKKKIDLPDKLVLFTIVVVDRRNCVRGNAIESRCARANFLIGMLITLRFRVHEMLFFPRARSSYYRYALFSWTVGDGDRPMRTEPFVSYGIVRMQPCVRQKSTISFPLHHPLLLIFHLSLSLSIFFSFSVPRHPFAPFHRTPTTLSSLFVVFLTYLHHIAGDPTMLHARKHTRGLRNRVCLNRHIHSKLE